MKAAARWLNRTADQRGSALAVLSVGSFSVAHTVNAFFNTEIPQVDESVAWAAHAGLVIGAIVAFFAGFVAWLYLSLGIFVVMQIRARELSASAVTRRVGIAFVFPLTGFVVSILAGAVGAPELVSNGLYALPALYGLAVVAVALSYATGGHPISAVIAVGTPVVAALAVLALLALLGQRLAAPEALRFP